VIKREVRRRLPGIHLEPEWGIQIDYADSINESALGLMSKAVLDSGSNHSLGFIQTSVPILQISPVNQKMFVNLQKQNRRMTSLLRHEFKEAPKQKQISQHAFALNPGAP